MACFGLLMRVWVYSVQIRLYVQCSCVQLAGGGGGGGTQNALCRIRTVSRYPGTFFEPSAGNVRVMMLKGSLSATTLILQGLGTDTCGLRRGGL